jgi:serine/threonine protein kinase
VFRVLGRGAFGAVSAAQRIDTKAVYAIKAMEKKKVKNEKSEWMVLSERDALAQMNSRFVLNLRYAFHDPENLYFVFDLLSGGDLKFHLKREPNCSFPNARARFYAAEVLLGLEHIHSFDIVYRDLKPHNILVDCNGHCKISDLGLAIKLKKNKTLKHLAGTPGYWAPEIMQKTGTYKQSDFWSFGVFLYEMLEGKRPRCVCEKEGEWCTFSSPKRQKQEEETAASGKGQHKIDVEYPASAFTAEAKDLISRLLIVDPAKRLGAGGPNEIKKHPYFAEIDWARLANWDSEAPFIPDGRHQLQLCIGFI